MTVTFYALVILFTNSGGSGGVAIDSRLKFYNAEACQAAADSAMRTSRQVGFVSAFCAKGISVGHD